MGIPRFFVPRIDPGTHTLDLPDDEAHHAARVLRLSIGAEAAVFDGRGASWRVRVTVVSKDRVSVELEEREAVPAEPAAAVTLAIALLKHDQMDDVVRDAVMLGVSAIAPMTSAHVAVPDRVWKGARLQERWTRVAIASAKQCRRAVVPEIHPVRTFDDTLAASRDAARVICVEPARATGGRAPVVGGAPASALVLSGPEGGWSPEEVSLAVQCGCEPLSLGPRTLRAERAPIVALSVLWARWGW